MVPGLENHRAGQTWGGWEVGEIIQFSLVGVCNSGTLFQLLCFAFPFKMLFVLVWFVLFLLFTWSSDSVSDVKHGHSSLCCTKRKFALPQATEKHNWSQSLTELPQWKSSRVWAHGSPIHGAHYVRRAFCFVWLVVLTACFHGVRSRTEGPLKTRRGSNPQKHPQVDWEYLKNDGHVVNEWNCRGDKFLNTR